MRASMRGAIGPGLILALALGALPGEGQEAPFPEERVRRFVEKSMKAHEVTGLSVAVYDETGIRWAEGFGWADRRNRVEATPQTLYRIGSLTKIFTGLAVLQLAEQGKVDLEASLYQYLPDLPIEVPEGAAVPTVRSVLMHLSGLPSNHLNGMWGAGAVTREELFASLEGEVLAAPVDYVPSYSNLGFTLLGHLIEAVSGEPYAEYLETHLLGPMGMGATLVSDRQEPQVSRAYVGRKERADAALRDVAAGGVSSSATDLAALAELVLSGGTVAGQQILQPDTWQDMVAPQVTSSPFVFDREIALVWGRGPFEVADAGPALGHDGGTGLFFSLFLCLPQQRLCALALTNSRGGAEAQTEIVRGLLLAALEAKTGWVAAEEGAPSLRRVDLVPDDLAKVPGTYVTDAGVLRLEAKGRELEGEVDGTSVELVRMDDGYLHPRIRVVGLVRITIEEIALGLERVDGHDVLVQHRKGRRSLFGAKIAPRIIAGGWAAREGRYRLTNARSDLQLSDLVIERRHGFLEVEYSGVWPGQAERMPVRFILLPVTETDAVVAGLGRGRGDRVRFVTTERGEEVHYSGFRFLRQP